MKKNYKIISLLCACALCAAAAGCAAENKTSQQTAAAGMALTQGTYAASPDGTTAETPQPTAAEAADETAVAQADGSAAAYAANANGLLDTADLFSARDLAQTADLTNARGVAVSDGAQIEITEPGVYVLTGAAENCIVRVNAGDDDKVQLVLDGLQITNDDTPAIYVTNADKVFITTAANGAALSVTGAFTADGDVNTDAAVFSKDDLTFNGAGTLTIRSSDNGISGKDDVKFTGGAYAVTAAGHGVEANDSIAVCGGSLTVNAGKDALHAENDEDNTCGWILIADGNLDLTAGSDAVHAVTAVQIDGGTVNAAAPEGLEATYVQMNGGDVTVNAADDGVNAGQKSSLYTPTIEITGGTLTVSVGQGDTDALDANGDIVISGGTINITAASAFDYDGTATYTGGVIVVNGEELSSIGQSMMPGGMRGEMPGVPGGGMPGGFHRG